MLLTLALLACKEPDDTDVIEEANLSADPPSFDFGTILVGDPASTEVIVANAGPGVASAELDLEGDGATAWSVAPSSVELEAGAEAVVTLTFSPTAAGDYPARLAVLDLDVPLMGRADEDYDEDGHTSLASGGDDCDDLDATVHPGALDEWYDGVDADCAGNDDFDQDGDGFLQGGDDCDDLRADAHPGAEEVWYDDVDQDCAGGDDFDQDGDGWALDRDCDDEDPIVHPGATETWYDGVDQDCSGGSDYDQDDDGFEAEADCDDEDPSARPDGIERLDAADNDCSGLSDDMALEVGARGVLLGTDTDLALGGRPGLSHGDVDGDGAVDLIVVGPGLDFGYGFVVPAADAIAFRGSIADVATASFTGAAGFVAKSLTGPMRDVTDDGVDDLLLVGQNGLSSRAWLVAGGSGVTGTLDLTAADAIFDDGETVADRLTVATSGDVDGDGVNDVIAGWSQPDRGAVTTFFGPISASATADDADAVVTGETSGDALGSALAVADVDADGYADVLAGAPGRDDMAPDSGGVYLLPGSSAPSASAEVATASPWLLVGQGADTRLGGDALAAPADVDGDGNADVAVGSEGTGAVWIWLDAPSLSGVLPLGSVSHELTGPADSFGGSVALVDLDADEVAELVVGSGSSNTYAPAAGELFVFRDAASWSAGMGSADASATFWGANGDHVGTDAYGGFDADGDGLGDLLVGASLADGGAVDSGAVYVLVGW